MDTLINFLAFLLIAIAVAPLLLLGLYALASHFNLKIADTMLGWAAGLLKLQWFSGGLVNLLGGLALCALGIWMALHFGQTLRALLGVPVVVLGLWRAWRGATLLKHMLKTQESP
jgi:hypothetical protein